MFDRKPLEGFFGQLGAVELVSVSPLFLGAVHRRVRGAQQVGCVDCVVRINADPDTGRGAQAEALDVNLLAQGPVQLVCKICRVLRVTDFLEQHGEFVATKARHDVVASHALTNPITDRPQQLIAGQVSKRIVHHLETIEIQKQQRKLTAMASRALDGLLECRGEQQSVRQAGQLIALISENTAT